MALWVTLTVLGVLAIVAILALTVAPVRETLVGWAERLRFRERLGGLRRPAPGRPDRLLPHRARELLRTARREDDPRESILAWLALETEADALAYLELSPGGEEHLWTAPRGLKSEAVAEVAALARRALVEAGDEEDEIDGHPLLRWLGPGGSRVLVAQETQTRDDGPLRFGRYVLAWLGTGWPGPSHGGMEQRLRRVPGIAWSEVLEDRVRLLAAEGADPRAVLEGVARAMRRSDRVVEWVGDRPVAPEPAMGEEAGAPPATAVPRPERRVGELVSAGDEEEPRIRLLEVALQGNGEVTADVRVTWKQHEIRGRGHAEPGPSGRYYAAAQAVADALRPLLDTDIQVAGLYAATPHPEMTVIIAEILLEGRRYVGAVLERPDERDWTGARATLDAVNRRLTQVAGRSGRV